MTPQVMNWNQYLCATMTINVILNMLFPIKRFHSLQYGPKVVSSFFMDFLYTGFIYKYSVVHDETIFGPSCIDFGCVYNIFFFST